MARHSEEVLELLHQRLPTLGPGRLVCIDGPAASGKTTLAQEVQDQTSCRVIHMDDLYDGWDGLSAGCTQLSGVLRSLALGRRGTYRHYDWQRGAYSHEVAVEPAELIVIEGVGAGCAAVRDLITVLVWVEADEAQRRMRGASRTPPFVDRWEEWAASERQHFDADATRGSADLVIRT